MKAHRPFGSEGKQECLCHWCPLLLRGVFFWRGVNKGVRPTTRNASVATEADSAKCRNSKAPAGG